MRTFVLRTVDDLERLVPQWSELLVDSSDASPFLSHAWVRTWWEHFGDGDELHVVIAADGDKILGLAPMLRWRTGSGRLSAGGFVGIGQEAADYGGMLLGKDARRSGPAILEEFDRAVGAGVAVINLGRLKPKGDTLSGVRAWLDEREGLKSRWNLIELGMEIYPYRTLGAAAPEPLARLMKRNDVRRRLRRLTDQHEVVLDVHEPGETEARLDEFLELHDRRWATKKTQPTGVFVSSRGRAFLHDVSAALDREGWLRISFVRVDGSPIAGRYGTVMGGTYSGWKSGWDPDFQKYGPGHLIVGMLLEQLERSGLTEFDFMRGAGEHKKAWTSDEREIGAWQLQPSGWRGSSAAGIARLRSRQRYRARFS